MRQAKHRDVIDISSARSARAFVPEGTPVAVGAEQSPRAALPARRAAMLFRDSSLPDCWEFFELSPMAHLITDFNSTIRRVNVAAARILMGEQGLLVGKPLVVYISAEDRPAFRDGLTRLSSSEGDEVEEWALQLNGKRGFMRDVVATVCSPRGMGVEGLLYWSVREHGAASDDMV